MADPAEAVRTTAQVGDATNLYVLYGLIVQAIATVFAAMAGPWFAYRIAKLGNDMKHLEKNTNSIKDELIDLTARHFHAEGVRHERERQKMTPLL